MGFGIYSDMNVEQIINIHQEKYLIWIYYNMSNISFHDEILEYLAIRDEDKIPFPGTAPELTKSAKSHYHSKMMLGLKGLDYHKFVRARRKKIRMDIDYTNRSKTSVKQIDRAAKHHGQRDKKSDARTSKGGTI